MTKVPRNRLAWLQAIIVVCAYCGYRGLDFYTLYGTDILGMNEVDAARFVSYSTYLRPVAVLGAGFLADRLTTKKVIGSAFTLLIFSYIILVLISPGPHASDIFFNSIVGRIFDASPGIKGFHHFYLFLCLFAAVGITTTLFLARRSKKMISGV